MHPAPSQSPVRSGPALPVGPLRRLVARCQFHGWVATLVLLVGSRCLAAAPPSFDLEVMPILSRAGCNLGTCHGNFNGKGGLRLSLRGQDPRADYFALAQDYAARRINRVVPAESLMLLKPTTAVAHQGGLRLTPGSAEYELLVAWIAAGLPGPDDQPVRAVALETEPAGFVVRTDAAPWSVRVRATLSDGTSRDVTELASFEATNFVASVTAQGEVRRQQVGETTILVRYLDQQTCIRVAYLPAQTQPAIPPSHWGHNWVDRPIARKLAQLGLPTPEPADDRIFLRRAFLDTLGRPPTAREAQQFLADQGVDKRARLIDGLLSRHEFAELWASKWSDVLRNEEKLLDAHGVAQFHHWLVHAFADGMPLDALARALITGLGSTYDNPAANYYRALRDPLLRGETTARVFLGVRLECAKCHNHPFDRWTQDDYYDWAAVFAKIDYEIVENKRKDEFDKQEFVGEQRVVLRSEGTVDNPRSKSAAVPRLLTTTTALSPTDNTLSPLADWLTAEHHDVSFAAAQANRIWYHLLGRGLVDPIDDFRITNPASHPELLDALAERLRGSGYDLRYLVREIMMSATYQALPADGAAAADSLALDNYAAVAPRRLTAEQLLDAQCQVLATPANFLAYPPGTTARQLAGVQRVRPREQQPTADERFLGLFGKPARIMSCECERSDDTTLSQAFNLLSGDSLQLRLNAPDNRLTEFVASDLPVDQQLEMLFWEALSRAPTEQERQAAIAHLSQSASSLEGWQDLAWAVMNAKEFLFRQ